MKTEWQNIEDFINFLEKKLCQQLTSSPNSNFTKVGPRCFFYKDDVDTIFIKVTDDNLIIITDGENVIDTVTMLPLYNLSDECPETHYEYYLQKILELF